MLNPQMVATLNVPAVAPEVPVARNKLPDKILKVVLLSCLIFLGALAVLFLGRCLCNTTIFSNSGVLTAEDVIAENGTAVDGGS